jgi:serine/threonine protein kinase
MSLEAGTKLGPYEIIAPLGAGGMGEVYRARDTRLDREVAIKVLPSGLADNADRLRRFEQEARAAGALNHPNILAIYDIGSHDGSPYIVSELLHGETLRERLTEAPIPVRKAIDFAVQIARGLAAAHEKGIVHRDLKPENVFVTNDGRVKVLDFGLAKLTETSTASDIRTVASGTEPGVVLGTVGYMSPEQVRGKPVDHRSDIFNFGAILYETLSGERAFRGDSGVETMNAILKEDPPELVSRMANVPPALDRLIRRCLEKNPDERFRSAHDLAFALEALSGSGVAAPVDVVPETSAIRSRAMAAIVFLFLLLITGAFFVGRRSAVDSNRTAAAPAFNRLTFRHGTIRSARFSPDGKTILYGAAWDGDPLRIFLTRPESPESTPFPLPDADILSISSASELAVSLGRTFSLFLSHGTLARAPMVGGSSRQILDGVSAADWSSDGKELAIIRRLDNRDRLEIPIGKVLLETAGYFSHLRVAPDGTHIAFLDHPYYGDNRGTAAVVDLQGHKTTLSPELAGVEGLAWGPDGTEVWYTGTLLGERVALYSSDLAGHRRMILQVPIDLAVHDVFRGGRALLSADTTSGEVFGIAPGETKERNLGALSFSVVTDISQDGRIVLLSEFETGGTNYTTYIRRTDGSQPVRLGEGSSFALSPDGRWAAVSTFTPPALHILPTGPGEPKLFRHDNFGYEAAKFLTNERLIIVGSGQNHRNRMYVMDIADGKLLPITPEGVPSQTNPIIFSGVVSPDGTKIAITGENRISIYTTTGQMIGSVPGSFPDSDRLLRWASDGRAVFVSSPNGRGTRIFRLDLTSGRREVWRDLAALDPAGIVDAPRPVITPDGKTYAYSIFRIVSDLYLVEGLK